MLLRCLPDTVGGGVDTASGEMMSGKPRDTTVRNVLVGAAACFLFAVLAATLVPWLLQQWLNTSQGLGSESYGWIVAVSQMVYMALFPLGSVLIGVAIILGWLRNNLRKAPVK